MTVAKINPYKCTFEKCKKSFQYDKDLVKHARVHTGEKPYICTFPECTKAFTQKGNLTIHFKKHEKDNNVTKWLKKVNTVHGGKYDYSSVVYVKAHEKVNITCKKHGVFIQTPTDHATGRGCPKCANENRNSGSTKLVDKFIEDAIAVHGTKYDYSKVAYVSSKIKVEIICPIHYIFKQSPNHHLRKDGCPTCAKKHSRSSIEWLEFVASACDIHIQHATNGGEYKIGRYKIDGYCKETNTCYEYHGTMWHAHPNYLDPTGIHPVSKKINQTVYQNTLAREAKIRELGYNLVVMWEHEWKDLCDLFLS
jgi:hypothetical protein